MRVRNPPPAGMPGPRRETLLPALRDTRRSGRDPLVHLALHADPRVEFLKPSMTILVRLLEQALERVADGDTRARLLARLSRQLLGDPLAMAIVDEH